MNSHIVCYLWRTETHGCQWVNGSPRTVIPSLIFQPWYSREIKKIPSKDKLENWNPQFSCTWKAIDLIRDTGFMVHSQTVSGFSLQEYLMMLPASPFAIVFCKYAGLYLEGKLYKGCFYHLDNISVAGSSSGHGSSWHIGIFLNVCNTQIFAQIKFWALYLRRPCTWSHRQNSQNFW